MLSKAHEQGVVAALSHFKVAGIVDFAKRSLIGDAGRAFVQGPKAFSPGGALHWKNVFWPSQYGTFGNWIGRAGTLAMVPMAMRAVTNPDPNEGRASHALGTLGRLAGGAYGGMAGGMLGMPLGAALGGRLGHGAGHLLGSAPPPQPPQDPFQ
jgi:hypothetical protein